MVVCMCFYAVSNRVCVFGVWCVLFVSVCCICGLCVVCVFVFEVGL